MDQCEQKFYDHVHEPSNAQFTIFDSGKTVGSAISFWHRTAVGRSRHVIVAVITIKYYLEVTLAMCCYDEKS